MPNSRGRIEKAVGTGKKKISQDNWGAMTQAAPKIMRRTERVLMDIEVTGDSCFGTVMSVALTLSSGSV